MDIQILLDTPPWDWPEGTAQTFHQILTNPRSKPADRAAAIDMAGNMVVINGVLAADLLAVVRSPGEPAELRARAAISLGPVLETVYIDGFEDELSLPPITEDTFHQIEDSLEKVYRDTNIPKEVRRRALEASVRAPQPWHTDAIRAAYSSGDNEWILTAVFAMRWVRGFDDQILEALQNPDPEIHTEAVFGAGERELGEAWPHIVSLVEDPQTPKDLLLAAIEAVGTIRPNEAALILADLADSEDEEIAEAADEAIGMAASYPDDEVEEDEEEDEDDDE